MQDRLIRYRSQDSNVNLILDELIYNLLHINWLEFSSKERIIKIKELIQEYFGFPIQSTDNTNICNKILELYWNDIFEKENYKQQILQEPKYQWRDLSPEHLEKEKYYYDKINKKFNYDIDILQEYAMKNKISIDEALTILQKYQEFYPIRKYKKIDLTEYQAIYKNIGAQYAEFDEIDEKLLEWDILPIEKIDGVSAYEEHYFEDNDFNVSIKSFLEYSYYFLSRTNNDQIAENVSNIIINEFDLYDIIDNVRFSNERKYYKKTNDLVNYILTDYILLQIVLLPFYNRDEIYDNIWGITYNYIKTGIKE
jgi:hypothetical protein